MVELRWSLGGTVAQEYIWRYLVAALPKVLFEARDGASFDSTLRVCATAQSTNVPPHSFQPRLTNLEVGKMHKGTREVSLEAGPAQRESATRMCREARLPSDLGPGRAKLEVSAQVKDITDNLLGTESQHLEVSLVQMGCSRNSTGQATQPLVFANRRLAFGAAAGLYVFDADKCAAGLNHLPMGAVQGPMVALGSGGRLALALGSGGAPPRQTPRLALVTLADASPAFVYEDSRDCTQSAISSTSKAVFDRGLSLLSIGNADGTDSTDNTDKKWRFAAPANEGTSTRLMAYAPHESAPALRCVTRPAPNSFLAPTVQREDGNVVGVYGPSPNATFYQGAWPFNPSTPAFTAPTPSTISGEDKRPPGLLAVAENTIWIKDASSKGPAAIDSSNRVYDVASDADAKLRLRRFPLGDVASLWGDALLSQAPVGSPLLGEPAPNNPAEVYVVTTDGGLFIFDADNLQLLWRGFLGFAISAAAQPVLTANADGSGTLWVVGERGEIRGIRVGNSGLNRRAQWPKAFRDNCNTSSRLSTPDTLPGCF